MGEQDPALSYPHLESTVTMPMLVVLAIVLPSLCLLYMSLVGSLGQEIGLLALQVPFFLGLAAQWLIVNAAKCYCGRLRPNFFALCNYEGYADALDGQLGAWSRYFNATQSGRTGDISHCLDNSKQA